MHRGRRRPPDRRFGSSRDSGCRQHQPLLEIGLADEVQHGQGGEGHRTEECREHRRKDRERPSAGYIGFAPRSQAGDMASAAVSRAGDAAFAAGFHDRLASLASWRRTGVARPKRKMSIDLTGQFSSHNHLPRARESSFPPPRQTLPCSGEIIFSAFTSPPGDKQAHFFRAKDML